MGRVFCKPITWNDLTQKNDSFTNSTYSIYMIVMDEKKKGGVDISF